jgi:hypothetical protein
MTGTISQARTESRPKIVAPMIREVCLIGSPGRTYIHVTLKGLRTEDSGLKKARNVGNG